MRLLVTRPEPEASQFAAELAALGHEPVLQPLLRFVPMEIGGDALDGAGSLLLTSSNALRALQAAGRVEAAAQLPLFAVGESTARRAVALGFKTVIAVAGRAAELVPALAASPPAMQPVVHLSARHRAFDFPAALSPYELPIRTLTVYAMEARQALDGALVRAFEDGTIGGVVSMSARTAKVFVSHCVIQAVRGAENPVYFCLSQRIANQILALGAKDVRVSARPTKQALLGLLPRP